jgi:hypothetical protein
MKEQARYTLDERNLRKPQMDPERMIEQLTASSEWWDKYAKTLTGSQKRKDAEDPPFTPYDKKSKGGGGGNGAGAFGSSHGNGGGRREERRPEGRRSDDKGAKHTAGATGGDGGKVNHQYGNRTPAANGSDKEPNPFNMPGWATRGTYANKHSLWVMDSTRVQRQHLTNDGKCSICKEPGRIGKNYTRMAQMYSAKHATSSAARN